MSGVIYKITVGNEVYVGSTNDFKQRKCQHKNTIYNENLINYNFKLYQKIRENNGEWEMTIYEDNLSITKDKLCIREEEVRLLLGATLNGKRAYRTDKERREEQKIYNEKNKEKINEINKVKIKCECGSIIRRSDIAHHRKSNKHITLLTSSA